MHTKRAAFLSSKNSPDITPNTKLRRLRRAEQVARMGSTSKSL